MAKTIRRMRRRSCEKKGRGKKRRGWAGYGLGGCSGTRLAGWSGRLEPGRLHSVVGKSDDTERNVFTPAARHVCFCPVIPLEQRVHLRPQSRLRVAVDVSYELRQKPLCCFFSCSNFGFSHPDHTNDLKCFPGETFSFLLKGEKVVWKRLLQNSP